MMKYFIDTIIGGGKIDSIIYFALVFLGVYIFMGFIAILIKYLIVILENRIVTDIRNEMFKNIVFQPLSFYREHKVGAAMERILRDADVVHSIWGFLFPSVFCSVLTFITTFAIIFAQSMLIALLSLLAIAIYVFIFKYYNEKLRKLYNDTRNDIDSINTSITDAWNGAKEIKIFMIEKLIIKKFEKIINLLRKDKVNMAIKNELSKQLMSFATTLGTLFTLCIGGYLVMKGNLTIGTLVALQAYVAKLYSPAQDIADMAVDYKKYQVNLERISQILYLDREEVVKETEHIPMECSVEIQNVGFSYGNNNVLKDISFEMKGKGKIAVVGKSGAGKTTLINLLLGFMNPSKGKVFIGGHDIADYPLDNLRRNITLVSQDTFLFNMSVYDNIRIGNPEAGEEELQKVARLLEIDKIVDNLPDKMNTVIAEMGKNVSGGQLQRISIARALLKKSPIMIFDEATSNIDSQSEQIIHDILDKVKKNALVIVVSHRLSSLKDADMIYVLDNGSIIESGKLEELSSYDGAFASLFRDQFIDKVS
jgi:ABC-type multidrug transport system fused ATPase/permease subunit